MSQTTLGDGLILAGTDSITFGDGTQLNSSPICAGKNKIINGNFDIWQRGTSFSTPANYIADRWYFGGAASNFTCARATRPAGNGGTYMLSCTPSSATNALYLFQGIESFTVNSLKGKSVVLSFMAYVASGTATLNSETQKSTTADSLAASWSIVNTQANSLTTTPTRFTMASTVASDGTANGYLVGFNGTNLANGVAVYIYDVQLEPGTIATPFSLAGGSYGGDDILCKRYYERLGPNGVGSLIVGGVATGGGQTAWVTLSYVPKRAAPNVTKVGTWSVSNTNQPALASPDVTSCFLQATSLAAGQFFAYNNGAGQYIEVEKEL